MQLRLPEDSPDAVRCLDCSTVYGRLAAVCPRCGGAGWLSAAIPVSEDFAQRRFGEDPPPGPIARQH